MKSNHITSIKVHGKPRGRHYARLEIVEADSRSLVGDGGRHEFVDLGSVVRHGEDEERLVVWQEKDMRDDLYR